MRIAPLANPVTVSTKNYLSACFHFEATPFSTRRFLISFYIPEQRQLYEMKVGVFLPLGFRQMVVSQTCLSVIWKYIYIDRILKNYISLSDKKSNRSHLEPIVSRQKIFNILRFMSFIDNREAPLIQFCFVLEIYKK